MCFTTFNKYRGSFNNNNNNNNNNINNNNDNNNIIITVIVIVVLVIMIMIINFWLSCLGEIFVMSKDDHVDKNKDGALNSKAKQYSDSNSDEDVKLSGKYLDR